MKKIFALFLVAVMLFSFAACGSEEEKRQSGVSSGNSVDQNTLNIVETAFGTTQNHLDSAKALGYSISVVSSFKVDDVVTSSRVSSKLQYITNDEGRKFSAVSEIRSGESAELVQLYSDGKKNYGYKAGATYELSGKDVDGYIAEQFELVKLWDTTDFKALDTKTVKTSTGGHGFVITYDVADSNVTIDKVLASITGIDVSGMISTTEGVKITGFLASGIVDETGKLATETVTLKYEYTVNVEVSDEETEVEGEETDESKPVETVEKKVSCELNIDIVLDYDVSEISIPDKMTGIEIPEDDEETKKPDEISIPDFNKLSTNPSNDSDKNENNKSKK